MSQLAAALPSRGRCLRRCLRRVRRGTAGEIGQVLGELDFQFADAGLEGDDQRLGGGRRGGPNLQRQRLVGPLYGPGYPAPLPIAQAPGSGRANGRLDGANNERGGNLGHNYDCAAQLCPLCLVGLPGGP
jgi:hypothetical protein